VEFLQNQALDERSCGAKGTIWCVDFSRPAPGGDELNLRFPTKARCSRRAGQGLLYVGERGTWYPSFGLSPAQFDLEFEFRQLDIGGYGEIRPAGPRP